MLATRWWERGILYHVYVRSFMDSDGNGVGDLRGIASRLDYLESLGVDAVWLTPVFASPLVDSGYDVSDYTAVHPVFGTMADFDGLIASAHQRRLKVVLDLVPNHTSVDHLWFKEARSSRESLKRDWYIWSEPAPDGGPPNDWQSVFGGSAWEWDEATAQYYYHAFLPEQPELNWLNPEVQEALLDVMRFWLDRGVDGFRVEVMWPPKSGAAAEADGRSPRSLVRSYVTERPELHEVVRAMRGVIDEYEDRLLIWELFLPVKRLVTFYGGAGDEAHLPFNFHLITTPWEAPRIAALIEEYEGSLPEGGWPNWVLGNHDRSRIASRVGPDQARIAAMLLMTLRGTPTLYYGEEIGMTDGVIPADRAEDPLERRFPGRGLGRDPVRTPMQWDGGPRAGFSTAEPWLPVAPDANRNNVAAQAQSATSMLSLYRRLAALRRAEPALLDGTFALVPSRGNALAYVRERDGRRFLVALNLSDQPAQVVPRKRPQGIVALGTHQRRGTQIAAKLIELLPHEGMIIQLTG